MVEGGLVGPGVIRSGLIGPLAPPKPEEQRVVADDADGVKLMREYGYSIHPDTQRTRAVTVLMALETEALKGHVTAAREFLDRTTGKVMDVVLVGHGRFAGTSDKELLEKVLGKKKK